MTSSEGVSDCTAGSVGSTGTAAGSGESQSGGVGATSAVGGVGGGSVVSGMTSPEGMTSGMTSPGPGNLLESAMVNSSEAVCTGQPDRLSLHESACPSQLNRVNMPESVPLCQSARGSSPASTGTVVRISLAESACQPRSSRAHSPAASAFRDPSDQPPVVRPDTSKCVRTTVSSSSWRTLRVALRQSGHPSFLFLGGGRKEFGNSRVSMQSLTPDGPAAFFQSAAATLHGVVLAVETVVFLSIFCQLFVLNCHLLISNLCGAVPSVQPLVSFSRRQRRRRGGSSKPAVRNWSCFGLSSFQLGLVAGLVILRANETLLDKIIARLILWASQFPRAKGGNLVDGLLATELHLQSSSSTSHLEQADRGTVLGCLSRRQGGVEAATEEEYSFLMRNVRPTAFGPGSPARQGAGYE